MTPLGIDPAPFWFVAQCLNQCAECPPFFRVLKTMVGRYTGTLSVIPFNFILKIRRMAGQRRLRFYY
jgi:hypothetical protein